MGYWIAIGVVALAVIAVVITVVQRGDREDG